MNTRVQTCTQKHAAHELVKHEQGAQNGFAANFHAQKLIFKVKTLLLPHLSGSLKTLEIICCQRVTGNY